MRSGQGDIIFMNLCQSVVLISLERDLMVSIARRNATNLHWIKLNTSLDDIDWAKSSMSDGAADTTGGGTLQVVHQVILGTARRSEEDGTWNIHGQRQNTLKRKNDIATALSLLMVNYDVTMTSTPEPSDRFLLASNESWSVVDRKAFLFK
jgi:hypothetical protein